MHQTPRSLNAQETFDRLVSWVENKIREQKIPGIIVGVSGTDSLLTFLAVYHAYKRLGMPERALAVNFIHTETRDDGRVIKCEEGDKNWFADHLMPWLKQVAPDATFEIDDTIPYSDDNKRWGHLFSRALSEVVVNQDLGGQYHFVAGTRNRTEKILGTYTLISKNPSLQPIEHLYKTEVLQLCRYLNVPQIALDKSREIDCACGRFQVQAHYMDQLDAFIMTEKGELDPAYLNTIPEDILIAVREFYVEETTRNKFREEIPYRTPDDLVALEGYDIATALSAAGAADSGAITRAMPVILEDWNAAAAHRLLTASPSAMPRWRAEALALLGTRGLDHAQTREAVEKVFPTLAPGAPDSDIAALAAISARIGQYGFSFPAKRFTAMGFEGGPSLLERAGYARLIRGNDVRDADLPKSNPARDEFGTGFAWHDDQWYIEQRRAYMLVSHFGAQNPVTLLIRNSSPFFGRDRLSDPAYVSWAKHTPQSLKALSRAQIEDPGTFTPWHMVSNPGTNKLERVHDALDFADAADVKFSQWLRSREAPRFKTGNDSLKALFNDKGGAAALHAFLKSSLMNHIAQDRGGSPLYLSGIPKGAAPWRPAPVLPVDANLLRYLKTYCDTGKITDPALREMLRPALSLAPSQQLVLLTSRQGDYPVAPR